jgi:TatD DNase family protein
VEFFDTHAHYDDEHFDEDREQVLNKIYEAGVTKCVNVGCSIETSKNSIELAKKCNFVYAMCGIHPSEISNSEAGILKDIQEIKKIVLENNCVSHNDEDNLKDSKKEYDREKQLVVAIGEIGLDYHYEGFDKELQKFAFIEQIKLANELNLPIAIHTRDAIDDTIAILREHKVIRGGILHCCPFNRELVKHGLENGFHIAFGGTSTFKNSKNACEIVNMVPDDKILIETDSPYLAPEPYRGTRNDSSNLKFVVQKLAEFRGITPEQMAKITYENACRFFFN